MPPRKEIAKVSLGAENLVPWGTGDVKEIIANLKSQGYRILALENMAGAKDITTIETTPKDVLVLGSEVEGIAPDLLALTDLAVIIPMAQKQSLNVSVASGVAMFALRAQ